MPGTPATRSVVQEPLSRIAEPYAQECDWRPGRPKDGHGRPDTPWNRHRATRADVAGHFREPAAHRVPQQDTSAERILVDGEDAVVPGVIRHTPAPTGRAYTARFALHLTVRGGLAVRRHVYEDSLAAARAFAPKRSRTLDS
ncbi:ketosteroid isomerase [Streptomyces broussonetiae]|uniref:Ketosteroid isomerase n=1 Tax=Streptomyces broussonetiae TaxID=2686304 RepID=A0A6I6NAP6_9ACTN|nr:nuclear transport factor 2 family protein [Streptomyces broussonetiae]QHA08502.1 ketosteroid isomerase [Streptomyces broussonetiae]